MGWKEMEWAEGEMVEGGKLGSPVGMEARKDES